MEKSELQQIAEIVGNFTPDQTQEFNIILDQCVAVFRSHSDPFEGLMHLYAIADDGNELMKGKVTCKKGCSFCCYIRVACTELEAKLIVDYCEQKGIEIDEDKLNKLATLGIHDYMLSPHRRCTFLSEEGTCKIYEVRPMSCRNHFVTTPAYLCDTADQTTTNVSIPISWKSVIAGVALLKVTNDDPGDSLPNRLLTELNNK